MKIVFYSNKEGTGTTTLSSLIAYALAETGFQIRIIDTDPNKSASKLIQIINHKNIKTSIINSNKNHITIIDAHPRLDPFALNNIIFQANKFFLVTSTSPIDLWSTEKSVGILKKILTPSTSLSLIFNKVRPQTVLAKEIPSIAKLLKINSLASCVCDRVCYEQVPIFAWNALNSKAKKEIFTLALEIIYK